MKSVFDLLNHDNTISVNRRLAHALGLGEAVIYAALLAKHEYYSQRGALDGGWFYSTVGDMEESTSLTKCQQSRCIKRLVSAGLIQCQPRGLPARRFFLIVDDIQLLEGLLWDTEPQTARDSEEARANVTAPEENAPSASPKTARQDVRKPDSRRSENPTSCRQGTEQKTKVSKTKENKPEHIKQDGARAQINHGELSRKYGEGFADLAAEVTAEGLAGAFTLTIDGRNLSAEDISSAYGRVDHCAVCHVADYMCGRSDIRNIKAYLRSALYKSSGELSQKPAHSGADAASSWEDDRRAALNADIMEEMRRQYADIS